MSVSWRLWIGWGLSGLVILFLIMDGVMKLAGPSVVVQAQEKLGYPSSVTFGLGVLLLVCTALYAIPKTSVFGAILLTGYFGGAIASQLRIGEPAARPIVPDDVPLVPAPQLVLIYDAAGNQERLLLERAFRPDLDRRSIQRKIRNLTHLLDIDVGAYKDGPAEFAGSLNRARPQKANRSAAVGAVRNRAAHAI